MLKLSNNKIKVFLSLLFLLLGIFLGFNFVKAAGPCDNGQPTASQCKFSNSNGYKYFLSKTKSTWKTAKETCKNWGGMLATIADQNEYNYIKGNFANSASINYIWLGGTDETLEGTWKWVTGTTFSPSSFDFATNQPDNSGGNEDYLALRQLDKKLYDFPNTKEFPFLCKFAGSITEQNDTLQSDNFADPEVLMEIVNLYNSKGIELENISFAVLQDDPNKIINNIGDYKIKTLITFEGSRIIGLYDQYSGNTLLLPKNNSGLLDENKQYTLKIETLYDGSFKQTPTPKGNKISLLDESGNQIALYENLSITDNLLTLHLFNKLNFVFDSSAKVLTTKVEYEEIKKQEKNGYVKFYNIALNDWYKSKGVCGKDKTLCERNYMLKWYSLVKNENGNKKLKGIQAVVYFDKNNNGTIQKEEIVGSFYYALTDDITTSNIKFPTSSSELNLENLTKSSFKIDITTELKEQVDNFINKNTLIQLREEKKLPENHCPANPLFVYNGNFFGLPEIYNNEKFEFDLPIMVKEYKKIKTFLSVNCKEGNYKITEQTEELGCISGYEKDLNNKCVPIQTDKDFNFTGKIEKFIIPISGKYKLEAWGGQGGGWNRGGKGAYAKGEVILQKGTVLYLSVGQFGERGGFGGGGKHTEGNLYGGGASDIRLSGNDLNTRILVAGGGGCATGHSNSHGGYAGGTGNGGSGSGSCGTPGYGATQTKGGQGGGNKGSFGKGGDGKYRSRGHGGAGGGGWYGGGGAHPDSSANDDKGGGGGSSYALTSSSHKPSGYNVSSKYYLSNTQLIAGKASMPNKSGFGNTTGNSNDGKIKIKLLEAIQDDDGDEIVSSNCYFPLKGLKAYFPFDKTEITNYFNQEENLITQGNLNFISEGKKKSAYHFGGNKSRIQLNSTYDNLFKKNFAISFWLKPGNNQNNAIFEAQKTDTSGTAFSIYSVNGGNSIKIYYRLTNNSSLKTLTTINNIDKTKFSHFLITSDIEGKIKVYFNGELKYKSDTFFVFTDNVRTTIGGASHPSYGQGTAYNFIGDLDEFVIYKNGLSDKSIALLYNNGKGAEKCGTFCDSDSTSGYDLIMKGYDYFPYKGLLAYYTFDVNGKPGQDTNNMYNGTTSGSVNESYGKIGKGIYIENGSKRINLSRSIPLNNRNFTLSTWVKFKGTVDSGNVWGKCLFLSNSGTSSTRKKLHYCFREDGHFVAGHYSDDLEIHSFNPKTNSQYQDKWLHIVLAVNNTNTKKTIVYINGKKFHTQNHSGIYTGVLDTIGGGAYTNRGIKSYMDEIGIWDRVLSEREVKRLYNNGNGITYPGTTISCGHEVGNPNNEIKNNSNCRGYEGIGYMADPGKTTARWTDAESFCKTRGGELAKPNSTNYDALMGIVRVSNVKSNAFFNITDLLRGQNRYTLGREGLSFPLGKWKWNSGEPNNPNSERYGHLYTTNDGGKFGKVNNLRNNNYNFSAICQYDNKAKENPLVKDLISYFNFEGENVNLVEDIATGNATIGTSYSIEQNGKIGKGLKFNAKNSSMWVHPIFSDHVSVSMWYKMSQPDSNHKTLIGRDGSTYHHLLINPGNNILGVWNNGFRSTGTVIETGKWYHIVFTNNQGRQKIYVNGKKVFEENTFRIKDYPIKTFGNYRKNSTQGALGIFDEIGIWNRILTDDEITKIYNDGKGIDDIPYYTKRKVNSTTNNTQEDLACIPKNSVESSDATVENSILLYDKEITSNIKNVFTEQKSRGNSSRSGNQLHTGTQTDAYMELSTQLADIPSGKTLNNLEFNGEVYGSGLSGCRGSSLEVRDVIGTKDWGFLFSFNGEGQATIPRAASRAHKPTPSNITQLIKNLRGDKLEKIIGQQLLNTHWNKDHFKLRIRDKAGKNHHYVIMLDGFNCSGGCKYNVDIKNKKGKITISKLNDSIKKQELDIDFSGIDLIETNGTHKMLIKARKTCGAVSSIKLDKLKYLYQ